MNYTDAIAHLGLEKVTNPTARQIREASEKLRALILNELEKIPGTGQTSEQVQVMAILLERYELALEARVIARMPHMEPILGDIDGYE